MLLIAQTELVQSARVDQGQNNKQINRRKTEWNKWQPTPTNSTNDMEMIRVTSRVAGSAMREISSDPTSGLFKRWSISRQPVLNNNVEKENLGGITHVSQGHVWDKCKSSKEHTDSRSFRSLFIS